MTGYVVATVLKFGVTEQEADEIAAWVNEKRAFLESRGFEVRVRFVETRSVDK